MNTRPFPVLSCLALTLGLAACGEVSAINSEVLRSAPDDEEPQFVSRSCMLVDEGLSVGGSTNDYLVREEWIEGGAVRLTYLLPPVANDVEDPLDESEDADELEVAAVIELTQEELDSGEVFSAQFERADGVVFEVSHWGTPDCED